MSKIYYTLLFEIQFKLDEASEHLLFRRVAFTSEARLAMCTSVLNRKPSLSDDSFAQCVDF